MTKGYQWLQEQQEANSIIKIRTRYYVLSSSSKNISPHINLTEMSKDYIRVQRMCQYKTFDEWATMKNSVYELQKDEQEDIFRCSCPHGLKWDGGLINENRSFLSKLNVWET